MAYSELIKNFAKIREYVSQFYVYGFKTRSEYNAKSARSYDNERRRIESWLGKYMKFNYQSNGKSTFLCVDSRAIPRNPMYNAFKAKSFTDNDITLHFYILDILSHGEEMSLRQIIDSITNEYLPMFNDDIELDESTIRKKIKEYEKLGVLKSKKIGKELFFSRCEDNIDLLRWKDAIAFFAEEDPIGVVGSYLLDKYDDNLDLFSFKHHYILHALESEVLEDIFTAMNEQKRIDLEIYVPKHSKNGEHTILPLKIYISAQNGRRYVLGHHYKFNKMAFFRLDNIKKVKILDVDDKFDYLQSKAEKFKSKLWGVSSGRRYNLDHIELTVLIDENESYILRRLEREKRCGHIDRIDDNHYKFVADVYDSMELMPWIRSFIGRITKLECSNHEVVEIFNNDLEALKTLYGGDANDI